MPCVCMATEKFPDRTVRYAMSPSTKVAGNCVNALPGSPQLLLLDQLGDRIRFKHYSMRTEQAYSDWMRRFGLFHNKRHAREMGVREVGFPHLPCCHGALRRQPRTRRRVRCRNRSLPTTCRSTTRRDEIAALIAKHQVVIVCGETGSGKTTQIPKICLELGRGTTGLIGHTQPRRIAARATATRIAQELQSEVGPPGRLQDPLQRPHVARCFHQADDRRHPARRDAGRPVARTVRHADHRRGARAQPEHRLPARLPQAAAAEAARPEADHHFGDDRCRALFAALRRARR
jgi:hypothetical protein